VSSLIESVVEYFQADEWPIELANNNVIRTAFRGENGQWACHGWVREQEAQFVFYSLCPVNVPENKFAELSEFITRANYGMVIGNFEMDYTDGEVRYKTSIDIEGSALTIELCRQMVMPNIMLMDRYLPGVMAVITGAQTPAQAIAQIEAH
jgi:hypothetical protein